MVSRWSCRCQRLTHLSVELAPVRRTTPPLEIHSWKWHRGTFSLHRRVSLYRIFYTTPQWIPPLHVDGPNANSRDSQAIELSLKWASACGLFGDPARERIENRIFRVAKEFETIEETDNFRSESQQKHESHRMRSKGGKTGLRMEQLWVVKSFIVSPLVERWKNVGARYHSEAIKFYFLNGFSLLFDLVSP